MKVFTTIVFAGALALSLSIAGCGDKGKDGLLKEYSGIVDEMCACKDFKCMEGVNKKMKAFGKKAGKKPPKELKEKVRPLRKKMRQCMRDLMKKTGGPGAMPSPMKPAPAVKDPAAAPAKPAPAPAPAPK